MSLERQPQAAGKSEGAVAEETPSTGPSGLERPQGEQGVKYTKIARRRTSRGYSARVCGRKGVHHHYLHLTET